MDLTKTKTRRAPNKHMQTDLAKRYAFDSAADARRYAACHLVTCNGMGYTQRHDSEIQAQRIGKVFF